MAPRLIRLAATALAALLAAGAAAQSVVTSPRPDDVDVTIYRDPDRSPGDPLERGFPTGYALISETRRIDIPAGDSEIRFEGVAAGLVPQSVIVSGLPDGLVERNRDAFLLSPGTLLDRSTGRRVTLRRTSVATGRVREMDAVIRTGADGAVVIETADGFEALRCTGLPDTIVYAEVPLGLSPRPTLSVRTRARQPVSATVTLAYLATGFDWQADYVATLSPDGSRMELFAWLTLASGDETSFPNADTQAVAGRVNWERTEPQEVEAAPIELRCWAHSTTSDIPLEGFERTPLAPPPPVVMQNEEFIVVTGSRIENRNLESFSPVMTLSAQQETLGDVKLYRIPEPVTIAARSQKQVALLQRPDVTVETIYRGGIFFHAAGNGPQAARRYVTARNHTEQGLGLPLPSGSVSLFVEREGRPLLIGEGAIDDLAVGQELEIDFGAVPGITTELRELPRPAGRRPGPIGQFEYVVRSDRAETIRFEAEVGMEDFRAGERLGRRDGRPLWSVTLPPHGTAILRFRARRSH
ncbi:MAG TPA: hypothetical protein VF702_13135 [Allosphingosinicella sp.]|jgi:hypothetical protein